MKLTPIALLLAFAAALIMPLPASAVPIHKHVWGHKVLPDGTSQRVLVSNVKLDVAPRDSDSDGVANRKDDCPQTSGSVAGCPPAPVAESSPAPIAQAPGVTTSYAPAPTTSGGCPSYMAAEASSPSAVNPSSGAAGCWQVTPGTAAAMGAACSDVNASSCAAAICASQGPSAWASSGANPCPYVEP